MRYVLAILLTTTASASDILATPWSECCANQNQPKDAVTLEAGDPQLFVDDWIIGEQDNLKRTLHQPVKDHRGEKPIIPTPPGQRTLTAKSTILYDPGLRRYVMYAKALPAARIYRYVSDDGMTWRGGDDGKLQQVQIDRRHPVEGVILENQYTAMHTAYYDPDAPEYPYKAWWGFGNWGPEYEGFYYSRSKDGIQWERRQQVVNCFNGGGDPSSVTIHQDGQTVYGPGDTTRFSYDPVTGRFLGIFKFFRPDPVGPGNQLRSRAYAFFDRLDERFDIDRLDRVALLPSAKAENGDQPTDEYYASTAYRCGNLWLGELLVWHSRDDYPYSEDGCTFAKLVSSRDGLHWKKVRFPNEDGIPEVYVPNGPEGGNDGQNDGGHMSLFSQGPLRIGNELILYYGCTSYGKNTPRPKRVSGGGIFRARLRPHGFVSVDQGSLTTRPLRFKGQKLSVNSRGTVIVEVLEIEGKVLGAARVHGDSLDHHVRFDGASLGKLASGKRVRLRFSVNGDGELYSFTVN